MGMVHPSFATSQGANQAFRGNIPPGCVWGTPLNPPGGGGPGWQGAFPNGARPLLGAAAASINFSRCHSAPVPPPPPSCDVLFWLLRAPFLILRHNAHRMRLNQLWWLSLCDFLVQ